MTSVLSFIPTTPLMYPTLILNSRTPLTITLKGNETQFELAGVRVRDGPLENIFLGGGGNTKTIFAQGIIK